jgi:sugar/nucleoside kinase (ribokinase family)
MIAGNRRWCVAGALHLDLSASVDRSCFLSRSDTQTWVDWRVELGGVAGNIARYFLELEQEVVLLAVVGDDQLGDWLVQSYVAQPGNGSIVPVRVAGVPTGIVNLIYLADSPDPGSRLVLGPNYAAIDAVSYTDMEEDLSELRCTSSDLVLDGYLLRGRAENWLAGLKDLRHRGWNIHLELVPHTVWQELTVDFVRELIDQCMTISASMSTLERLLGVSADDATGVTERAERFLSLARANGLLGRAIIAARFGIKDTEFSVIVGNNRPAELRTYEVEQASGRKGSQDRLYVMELIGQAHTLGRSRIGV